MKKQIIIFIIFFVLSILGLLAYTVYQDHKIIKNMQAMTCATDNPKVCFTGFEVEVFNTLIHYQQEALQQKK